MSIVSVKNKSGIPKYKQIVASIEEAISNGDFKKGDQLPSINALRDKHSLSRDTVLNAFNELKMRGIVHSVVGKGYYVSTDSVHVNQKVFLLFDELNSFKEDLYNAFLSNLDANIQVDIFFHHFNFEVFSKLILDNNGNYNFYVIMPSNLKNTNSVIENLPKNKVCVLDQTHEELSQYSALYQNFEKDIFENLLKGIHLIKKYKKLVLFFDVKKQPKGMLNGFNHFCDSNNIESEVIDSLENRYLEKGDVYLIPDDKSLIKIIKKVKEQKLTLSRDVGIISYNDTLLKEIVEGGITTISTDFNKMGERLAELIKNKDTVKIENPSNLILRNSL